MPGWKHLTVSNFFWASFDRNRNISWWRKHDAKSEYSPSTDAHLNFIPYVGMVFGMVAPL